MITPDCEQTPEAVEKHYNDLDPYYRNLWGEHLHHGYWIYGNETIAQATENLINLVVKEAGIDDHCKVLDIGCGYGATARYIARNIEAQVTALTISKTQWQYARTHDPESSNPRYILGDFLHNDFKPSTYDVAIAIESSEHITDKKKFYHEIFRLLKPGGRLIVCAWLCGNKPNHWEVEHLLRPICNEGHLASLDTEEETLNLIREAGFTAPTCQDLSDHVKKTWSLCVKKILRSALTNGALRHYLMDNTSSEKSFAKTLFRIWTAYATKAMRYGLFKAVKAPH